MVARDVRVSLLVLLAGISLAAGLAVMSVDFGSEFMKIAIVKPGVPMEIVLNKESNRKTATLVSLKDGERTFGDPALNAGIRFPKTAYKYLLDILGKHYDNPLVTRFQRRFPFYDLEKDLETGSVLFKNDDGVSYSVEVLVAMILQKAKEYAETFTEQPISEVVITVPPFFNQAERRAMSRAADLAGLKLLQLINDNTAVALNYGVFRRKIFNTTALNYMFFDMGASSTSATVVSYQVVKVKSPTSGVVDTFPQLTVLGVGFDRTLGGSEFQLRLTDHLAKTFNSMKKKKSDVTNDVRAMQKLYKEAGRVKHVLSANVDHFAQVESLLDDEDFRAKVTREEFETLCADLFPRVEAVVKNVLQMSQITMDEISEVILMGGGTRLPKVQEILKKAIGRDELGKGINSDEAAALGAVYQAAHLGKGFKVKKFNIKEANIYPIQVEFERVKTAEDSSSVDAPKVVKRTLFGRGQAYPQRKIMTFNKHTKDFSFDVTYADLSFLNEAELLDLGNTSLQSVSLVGIEDAYSKHSEEAESKGVKAHFRMDDSGVLHLDKVESLFEKQVAVVEVEAEESTLSKIGNTITNLFGGGKVDEDGVEEPKEEPIATESEEANEKGKPDNSKASPPSKEDTEDDKGKSESDAKDTEQENTENEKGTSDDEKKDLDDDAQPKVKTEQSEEAEKDSKASSDEDTSKTDKTASSETKSEDAGKDGKKPDGKDDKKDEKKEPKEKKPKLVTLRSDIKTGVVLKDLTDPAEEKFKESKKILEDMRKKDEETGLLEKAKNEIEAFVFDFQDKLEQKEYKLCSTEEERISITDRLNTVSDWLNEQDDSTPRKEYEDKLKDIKSATRDLHGRVRERAERPAAIEALNNLVNHTEFFLTGMRNYTGEDQPFTQVEFDALEKLIVETKEWNKTVHAEQAKAPLTQKPKFTVEDIALKLNALDREVKYLLNKAKTFRPKTKPKEPTANKTTTSSNETKSSKDDAPPKKKPTESKKTDSKLDSDILEDGEVETVGEDQSTASSPEEPLALDGDSSTATENDSKDKQSREDL